MNKRADMWKPVFNINTAIARALMDIEATKAVIENTTLSPVIEAQLRNQARIRSTHYSTRIEGNKLTLKEAQEVIEKKKTSFHGRARDVHEVRNYWNALIKVEEWASKKAEFNEDLIKRLHAMVDKGRRAKPTPYRDGQNVIKDSVSGGIVYMPPEAKDVTGLMAAMVRWVRSAEKEQIPVLEFITSNTIKAAGIRNWTMEKEEETCRRNHWQFSKVKKFAAITMSKQKFGIFRLLML